MRTTHNVSTAAFVADPASIVRNGGRQIDWANVSDAFKNADGKKHLPSGSALAATGAAGQVSPRAAASPAIGLLETDATEDSPWAAKSGYGVIIGGAVYETLLPDADNGVLAAAVKAELNAAGTGFAFLAYSDQR